MFAKKLITTDRDNRINPVKKSGIYIICVIALFIFIGILTTIKPAYRFSSDLITEWTNEIDSSTFLYLMNMENRAYESAYPKNNVLPKLSTILFQLATHIKPNDTRSLLGHEIPGFPRYGNQILIAGGEANHMDLSIESSPPLEEVLKDREAVVDEAQDHEKDKPKEKKDPEQPTTDDRQVVFIYNTHNRESFLPHLPGVTDPNSAHHSEVNITKVSTHFSKALENYGIGTYVDDTDHMNTLNENGWGYGQAYRASRTSVLEAVSTNKDIQYIFDLHRDSLPRDKTTIEINGEKYAQILMVVGTEHTDYEKNLSLATELHHLIEEKYPGLSKSVLPKEGPGNNGIYNQDLSENALLIEMGGYENTLEELYRTADVVAEVFSDYYWDAEKVDAQ